MVCPSTPSQSPTGEADPGCLSAWDSSVSSSASPLHQAGILIQHSMLDHLPGCIVEGMGHILETSIFHPSARHRHEQAILTLNHLEISYHEAIINGDRGKSFQLLAIDWIDANPRDIHGTSPLTIPKCLT